jgi:hypothetical protein
MHQELTDKYGKCSKWKAKHLEEMRNREDFRNFELFVATEYPEQLWCLDRARCPRGLHTTHTIFTNFTPITTSTNSSSNLSAPSNGYTTIPITSTIPNIPGQRQQASPTLTMISSTTNTVNVIGDQLTYNFLPLIEPPVLIEESAISPHIIAKHVFRSEFMDYYIANFFRQ